MSTYQCSKKEVSVLASKINIPEALMGQGLGVMQRLRNVSASPLSNTGVPSTVPYEWPDAKTVKYLFGDQAITFSGIHEGDYGRVTWAKERVTALQLLDEIEVPDGVPFTKTYTKTETEKTTLLEATKTALEAAFKEVVGQEYGTGITLQQRIETDFEHQFGHDQGSTKSDTFEIGPIEEPGKYRIYSYSFERMVSSRPIFDYHITWSEDVTQADPVAGPGNEIEYWKRAEWETLDEFLDFIAGKAPDDVGVLKSGRIVHGQYGSYHENPDVPLAPIYRQQRQVPDRFNPVPPIQQTVRYGQGTRVERVGD